MTQSVKPIASGCTLELPRPELRRRLVDPERMRQGVRSGMNKIAARVVASRVQATSDESWLQSPRLADIDPPSGLLNAERAANRIADAVERREHVMVFSDWDCDGIDGNAAMSLILSEVAGHPKDRITSLIGNRMKDSYGLSSTVADRILEMHQRQPLDLVMTIDCGSADEPRIHLLKQAGIDVIVLDHHAVPPDGVPASAYTTVNPNQPGCRYDKTIAGCMVAWLVAAVTRTELGRRGVLSANAPSVSRYLDYVALGTIADCVSLAGKNNRAVIGAGLRLINDASRPAWQAFLATRKDRRSVTAETCAYTLGPQLNARGRLDDPMAALHFLLATNAKEAQRIHAVLESENARRREIERGMTTEAIASAHTQYSAGEKAVIVFLEDGHSGVQGIVASRLVEAFGVPAFVFSPHPASPDDLVGSGRGIEGFSVVDALDTVRVAHPGLLQRGGGHKAAGGAALEKRRLMDFVRAYREAARAQLGDRALHPVIWTDGDIDPAEISIETVRAIKTLEPYGRGFEPPVFEAVFEVAEMRPVGDGTHLRMLFRTANRLFPAIWFRAIKDACGPLPVRTGMSCRVAFSLGIDTRKGETGIDMKVLWVSEEGPARRRGYI